MNLQKQCIHFTFPDSHNSFPKWFYMATGTVSRCHFVSPILNFSKMGFSINEEILYRFCNTFSIFEHWTKWLFSFFLLRLWSSLLCQWGLKSNSPKLFRLAKTPTQMRLLTIRACVISEHIHLTGAHCSQFQVLRRLKTPKSQRDRSTRAGSEPRPPSTLTSPPAPPTTPPSSSLRLWRIPWHPSCPLLVTSPTTGGKAPSASVMSRCRSVGAGASWPLTPLSATAPPPSPTSALSLRPRPYIRSRLRPDHPNTFFLGAAVARACRRSPTPALTPMRFTICHIFFRLFLWSSHTVLWSVILIHIPCCLTPLLITYNN